MWFRDKSKNQVQKIRPKKREWKVVVMRMKPQFLPSPQRLSQRARQSSHIWLLALGLVIAPCLWSPVWAENFNLESVDFTNNDAGMRIVLHTGSIVPVQKVLVSDNKLVLDIDQVNAGETVRTNFAGAGNVSHVIVQPLNEHKVRMIIRGESLSAPTVAFYGAGTDASGLSAEESARLAEETRAALRRQQEAGMQPAVNHQTPSGAAESAAVNHSALKDDDAPLAFGGFVDEKAGQHSRSAGIKPTETGPLALRGQMSIPTAGNDVLGFLTSSKLGNYIPFGLLAMVLLGTGVFVRHKLTQMNAGHEEYENFIEEQPVSGKRASFREMADAYRNKHEDKRTEHTPRRGNNADELIGLSGISQGLEDIPAPRPEPIIEEETVAPNTLEQILAAMQAANKPKKPMGVPAPKKQVVNQYAQAQAPKSKQQKSRQAADEAMLQEMKRAQAAQQELQQQIRAKANTQVNNPGYVPVNRAAAAKKAVKTPNFQTIPPGSAVNAKASTKRPAPSPIQPAAQANARTAPAKTAPVNTMAAKAGYSPATPKAAAAPAGKANGSLPNNPEVLNFLRNVADLMERDGKGNIARSIHKNLSAKNIQ
jgi:hypothetical protein